MSARSSSGFSYLSALALCFALTVPSSGCGDDDDKKKTEPPAPQLTGVMGKVTDISGAAVGGVTITAATVTTTTDAKGAFTVEVPAEAKTAVAFEKAGYVPTQKVVDVQDGTATALQVVMMPQAAAQPLDASSGGTISGDRGAQVIAAAGAFVTASGGAVSGTVDVHLTAFDPGVDGELEALPNLSAETAAGVRAELESFGVIDVTVRQGGEKLQVKSGETLTIRIPVATTDATPPDTIPLWSFNEAEGIWKEEGVATLLPAEGVYEGQIAHMSMWNADLVMESTCIQGVVKVESGAVLPGAYVTSKGLDYAGTSSATTDDSGRFCMAVRKSSSVKVTAIHPQGGGQSRDVQSGDGDTTVPPTCGGCLDVGEWVVKQGSYTGGDGKTVDCAGMQNPLSGTCADSLWDFAQCFQPAGKCTISLDGGISWENGAEVVLQSMQSFEYLGPDGDTCGSAEILDVQSDTPSVQFTTAAGQTFVFETTDQEGQVIVCPDGSRVELTSDEMTAFEACSGMDATTGEECELEGGFPGGCTDDTECTGGMVCCDFGSGVKMCVPPDSCAG